MSAIPPLPSPSYPWPADVLAFAAREKASHFLQPLLDVTRRLFPTAEIKVFFERDVSLPEEYIVFEVQVPSADVPDYLAAVNKWHRETIAVCPGPQRGPFVFSLEQVP
jgi:hypothetical protein